jgi:hypothetical protein
MNSIEYVTTLLEGMIQAGAKKWDIVRSVAKACIGWPYVFGAWGEQCTPANRNRRKRDDHPTIVSACQVLSGKKSDCSGCKWNLPVRMYDCRGFTDWVLKQVGVDLQGEGCTSQWNTKANWVLRGPISEMPRDRVCCVFVQKGNSMEHTGLYLGDGSTCECSSGVQYFNPMKSKWTHYAVPAGLYDDTPAPSPTPTKPTLRKGSRGEYVTLAQTKLIQKCYSCGDKGADGIFGAATEKAVKRFQQDNGLTVDGVIGPKTWEALDSDMTFYTVTIPHLPKYHAEALVVNYSGATMTQEGG